jgi:hypothetical protein
MGRVVGLSQILFSLLDYADRRRGGSDAPKRGEEIRPGGINVLCHVQAVLYDANPEELELSPESSEKILSDSVGRQMTSGEVKAGDDPDEATVV